VSFLFGNWALEEMGPAHVTLFHFSLAVAGPGASNDWLGKRLSEGYPAVPAWILTF
jgi:hypothetical protein